MNKMLSGDGHSMLDSSKTISDYLTGDDPSRELWLSVVKTVFHESPRQAHPERLSPALRTYYFVNCFDGELVNGGMSQFFSNSAGNHSGETLAALKAIGAAISAELLEKALTIFPNSDAPFDRQKRCDLLFAFEKRDPRFLDSLDKVYYQRVASLKSEAEEDLTKLIADHLRKHQAERVAG